jgi:hypothetical protein
LTPIEKQVVTDLINGYRLGEIADMKGFKLIDLRNLIVSIKFKYTLYFKEQL